MNNKNLFFAIAIMLAPVFVFASERVPAQAAIQPGIYKFGVDWERIERGIKTGDFRCHGTCVKASIDWKETWRTISGKNYRDRKKSNLQYCIGSYIQDKEIRDEVAAAVKSNDGQINEMDAQMLNQERDVFMRMIDRNCDELIGEEQRNRIKAEIYSAI